jgi:mono/diheme cytochrome c family protein
MRACLLALLAVLGCHGATDDGGAGPAPAPAFAWAPAERQQAIRAGQALIGKYQCTRCHAIDGLPGAGRPYDCVACHVFLKDLKPDDDRYQKMIVKNGKDVIDRYIRNIVHLRRVPDLTKIARRLRPAWIAEFVRAPFDVRPMLDDSMLRNRMPAADARALARYFAAIADVPDDAPAAVATAPAERVARGKEAFGNAGCPTCHTVGNEQFPSSSIDTLRALGDTALLAPNLRFAAVRMRPEIIADWIIDPAKVWPGATMPRTGMPRAQAELIRDYLVAGSFAPPAAPPVAPLTVMPPPAAHPVGWAEVKDRVLGKVCVHCHMNDHEKDVGPGNLGGLGFAGRGLAMRTYELLVRGARGDDGVRYSVLQARPGEAWPRILEVMVRRRVENLRDAVLPFADHARPDYADGLFGMPMGLPSMTDEELGILRRWLDDGCPGPIAVTGTPGFTDGFLVPDGPIAQNRGCGQRDPVEPPPAWATRGAPPAAGAGPR